MKFKNVVLSISAALAIAVSGLVVAAPVNAATKPTVTRAVVVRPSMTLHYVYNCINPTVEVDFYNVSGVKDVYVHTDQGYRLIAEDFNFVGTKVYDGYWNMPGVYQVDMFVTAPNAGPYTEARSPQKSTAATSLCPTYYPVYDAHYVNPTPPANSVRITFSDNGGWWPSD